jgi:hypothetical protein
LAYQVSFEKTSGYHIKLSATEPKISLRAISSQYEGGWLPDWVLSIEGKLDAEQTIHLVKGH